MTSIADLCADLPVVRFEPGGVLLAEGETSGKLYVLVDGAVEVVRGETHINTVVEPGALFGEMSILLGLPHTATVRALTACAARVTEDGPGFLKSHHDVSHQLAQLLAQRLHGVSTYLVDLKRQFEGEGGHLGVVDEILESLVHEQRAEFTPGSDRDPGY
ncbi:Crp/Fnr family transcriptional regulator [uncultured Phenylobacterium sp.]|uniref:Crp/Fnr family transcriptional regulator n=1 Tax=uncultured Phenylobacterium sp. TaxID=349273 RepID=UPI0025FF6884|nr:cyclic nucleotide-binding domain-containing protein [uncultured Phenylobacterium sp.]